MFGQSLFGHEPFATTGAAASSDVTVALTGQSATGAIGSLLAATALALSGGALTVSQGSVAPQTSRALTSQSASVAQGSVQILAPTTAHRTPHKRRQEPLMSVLLVWAPKDPDEVAKRNIDWTAHASWRDGTRSARPASACQPLRE
jgi:hypothetical protein